MDGELRSGALRARTRELTAVGDRFDWERAVRVAGDVGGTRLGVLLLMATYANRDGGQIRVSYARLAEEAQLTERAIGGHVRGALQSGWLQCEVRGGRSGDGVAVPSVYSLATPSRDTSTGTPVPDEVSMSTGTTVPVETSSAGTAVPVESALNRNVDAPQQERGSTSTGTRVPTTKKNTTKTTTNTTPPPPTNQPDGGSISDRLVVVVENSAQTSQPASGSAESLDALVEVILRKLPDQLAGVLDRRRLTQEVARLPHLGWTPELLAKAVTDWSWAGARSGGAVIHWVSRLDAPPAPTVKGNRTRPDVEAAVAEVQRKLGRFPEDIVTAAVARSREIAGRNAPELRVLKDAFQTLATEAAQEAS